MKLQKFRWSKVYESNEEELTSFLHSRNIAAQSWSVEAFDTLERSASQEVTVWCAEGSLALRLDSISMSMQPGDGLRIPANTAFTVIAGMTGCLCYEG